MIPDDFLARNIAFLGSNQTSASILSGLIEAKAPIVQVATREKKRRGRGSQLVPTPVEEIASESGLKCVYSLDDLSADIDFGIVVAFGKIIPPKILNRIPMVNIHFSQLPRYRGAAPVEWAVLNGDSHTGVSLMEVVDELDAGGVYDSYETEISKDENVNEIMERLGTLGLKILKDHMVDAGETFTFSNHSLGEPKAQVGDASYAPKIDKSVLRLNLNDDINRIQRLTRLGRAWLECGGDRLRIDKAAIGERSLCAFMQDFPIGSVMNLDNRIATRVQNGVLELLEVTPSGKRQMDAKTWYRGASRGAKSSEALIVN
ncbi:MAG: hypothetical protein HKL80_04000 [Acidimicrobiales bacterium]|nr:hypothetical protein [Acidimicrobiales bacterium]